MTQQFADPTTTTSQLPTTTTTTGSVPSVFADPVTPPCVASTFAYTDGLEYNWVDNDNGTLTCQEPFSYVQDGQLHLVAAGTTRKRPEAMDLETRRAGSYAVPPVNLV